MTAELIWNVFIALLMFIIEIDPLCAWHIAYIMYTTIQKFGEVIFF